MRSFLEEQLDILNEIKYIQSLYKEFIESYHSLNGTFGLDNPMEIMFLFTHLVFNGYISINHEYEFENVRGNQTILLGAYNFTGKSCCRNTAKMLSDILFRCGIKAGILINFATTLYSLDASISVEGDIDESLFSDRESITRLLNEHNMKLEQRILDGKLDLDSFRLEKRLAFGLNHAITIAQKDGISFNLDPTFNSVYRKRKIDRIEVLSSGINACIPQVSQIYNFLYKRMDASITDTRNLLKGISVTLEEELEARRKVSEITSNNQDIFEQFYRVNAPLYEEVSMKLEMVRRK